MPVIQHSGRLRQEDHKFKTSLGNLAWSCQKIKWSGEVAQHTQKKSICWSPQKTPPQGSQLRSQSRDLGLFQNSSQRLLVVLWCFSKSLKFVICLIGDLASHSSLVDLKFYLSIAPCGHNSGWIGESFWSSVSFFQISFSADRQSYNSVDANEFTFRASLLQILCHRGECALVQQSGTVFVEWGAYRAHRALQWAGQQVRTSGWPVTSPRPRWVNTQPSAHRPAQVLRQ